MALPAFSAARRAAAWLLLSNRSISPARRAHSSKPTTVACGQRIGQTDRRTDIVPLHKLCSAYYAGSDNTLNFSEHVCLCTFILCHMITGVVWPGNNGVGRINEVILLWPRWLRRWMTCRSYTVCACDQPTTLPNSAAYPRRNGKRLNECRSWAAVVLVGREGNLSVAFQRPYGYMRCSIFLSCPWVGLGPL